MEDYRRRSSRLKMLTFFFCILGSEIPSFFFPLPIVSHTLNHRIILIGTDFHGLLVKHTLNRSSNIQLLRDMSQELIGTDFHGQLLQYTLKSSSNIQLLRDTSQQALDVFTTSLAICCSSLPPSQRKDVCLPTQFSICLIILVTL